MNPFQPRRPGTGVALLASSLVAAGPAYAQAASYPVGAVVQSLQEDAGSALARHLRDLNSSPKNLTSLLGAGNAALEVGDPQAALTFFARAEEVAPRDGRVKAGMGSAFVQTEQAQAALKFFAEAVSMGAPISSFAKDRGLAYDMIGDNARAQADYAVAMQRGRDPEVERRLALSRAITGDREGALTVLAPQIARGDRAGYRARAFVLALTGDFSGATQAVQAVMPAQAGAMRPFLARLPELGPADRAMAVHFGHFPRAQTNAYAGAQYSLSNSPTPSYVSRPDRSQAPVVAGNVAQPAQRQLTEAAQPAPRTNSRRASRRTQPAQPVQIKAQPVPAQPEPVAVPTQREAEPQQPSGFGSATPTASLPTTPYPYNSGSAPVQTPQLPPSSAALDGPEQTRASAAAVQPEVPPPVAEAPAQPAADDDVDFGDVISAVQSLSSATNTPGDRKPVQLAEAAKRASPKVSSAKVSPPKAETKKADPPKAQEPSRIWVQLAAAQDKSAFPGEFKRLKTKASKLLTGKSAWTAPLGKTNRLLVGPFKTEGEARELVNELTKVQISSYSWVSDVGQKVDKIPAK